MSFFLRSAVAHVHRVMVIHRDIKPDNILLTGPGLTVRLADFGSASWNHPGDWHCDVVGSITNLAPEALPSRAGESASSNRFRGQPVDVWAAGACLYELGTGLAPFRAPTFPAMFAKIRQGRELVNLFAPSGLSTFPALWFMLAPDPALRCSADHARCLNCKLDWKFHFPPRKRQRRE